MYLLHSPVVYYLLLQLASLLLVFMSIMGIPGNPDEKDPVNKVLFKLWNLLLVAAWYGLPAIGLASLIAFIFHFDAIGKILSCLNMGIGIALFFITLFYYIRQPKKNN